MKKQYAIFLILIICAAMVSSSTLVIVLNMPLIAQTSQKLQAEAEQPAKSNPATETQTASAQTSRKNTVVADSSNNASSPVSGDFTPAEKEQIAQMLNDLGMQEKEFSADSIKSFQNQNSLSPTGNLDTNTLNEIIRQLSLVKAQAAVDA
ncbi:MAG: hypothetical protein ABFD08_05650 [Syntrophomonas sp.]